MKVEYFTLSAIKKWLVMAYSIVVLACVPARAIAEDRGIAGGYVNDPVITVPANSYTTFSTIYGGKRYYLGVDTTAAKSGKDTIAVYDAPWWLMSALIIFYVIRRKRMQKKTDVSE